MLEDRLLVSRFKRGSRDAMRRIYEKYKNDLLKLAVGLVRDANTTEDAVHDAFVNFARSATRIHPTGNLRNYLMACVANGIRNRIRDEQRPHSAKRRRVFDIYYFDFSLFVRYILYIAQGLMSSEILY